MSLIQNQSEHTYCPACKGTKTIIGLGTISHKCQECDGIGYVKRINNIISDQPSNTNRDTAKSVNTVTNLAIPKEKVLHNTGQSRIKSRIIKRKSPF